MAQGGHVLPGLPIAVDDWKQHPGVRLYFLTHAHADHTQGLRPTWSLGHIYCSELTKALITQKFGFSEDQVTGLAVGQVHTVPLDDEGTVTCTVTVLEANHCPGAVMYLFEGQYFGSILCTGDFRYHEPTVEFLSRKHIDLAFVDNTYCTPQGSFLSKDEAADRICEIIQAHFDRADIYIGLDTLGKEDLLELVALRLAVKISVTPERLQTCRLMRLADVFTTDEDETYVQTKPKNRVNEETLRDLNRTASVIGIRPTGLFAGGILQRPIEQHAGQLVHDVPYSDHSSYAELRQFLRRVRAANVVPIVKSSRDDFFRHMGDLVSGSSATLKPDVPPSVHRFMFPDRKAEPEPSMTRRLERTMSSAKSPSWSARRSRPLPAGVAFDVDTSCLDFASLNTTPSSVSCRHSIEPHEVARLITEMFEVKDDELQESQPCDTPSGTAPGEQAQQQQQQTNEGAASQAHCHWGPRNSHGPQCAEFRKRKLPACILSVQRPLKRFASEPRSTKGSQ